MAENKLTQKKAALYTGCLCALLSVIALIRGFAGKGDGLMLIVMICMGLYFCVARPYFGYGSYKLDKIENMLYAIFGCAIAGLLLGPASRIGIVLMVVAALCCYSVVYADKLIEPKEYVLALVGLAALIYAVFAVVGRISGSDDFRVMRILAPAAMAFASWVLVKDFVEPEDLENLKDMAGDLKEKASNLKDKAEDIAKDVTAKVKDAAEDMTAKVKDAAEDVKDTFKPENNAGKASKSAEGPDTPAEKPPLLPTEPVDPKDI